jgi:hypothetical protein
VRLGKHLGAWVASASVAWASEPAKNIQVEKIKLSVVVSTLMKKKTTFSSYI